MAAIDFQATGIPAFQCGACTGILAPRASAAAISGRFRFHREHGARFRALGETLANREKRRMEAEYGAAGPGAASRAAIPLPVVVPLADDAPPIRSIPVVTFVLIFLAGALYFLGQLRGARLPLPGGLPGLPSGTGFAGLSKLSLLLAPFLQDGIVPLAAGSLVLFVLGDNVEDRMGSAAFFLLYLSCGVCAGAAHVLWGKPGAGLALSMSGAVGGILGAYLVFFPGVSIRMYGMGRIVTIPAYLFACAWVVAVFFLSMRTGPFPGILFPSELSLAGNLAGFGSGAGFAALWRCCEG
jgi:membrane associated rhomboid family serine protease